jgi:5'-nucleotidase/UDP-sugar diphosphatase
MFSRILGSTAILAGLSMAAPVAAETTLHILHINDLHSRIQPINRFDSTCPAEDDAAGECFGGVARVATAINTLRDELTAAGENVIVLDAGDQFQGSLMYTTYKGDVEAEFMAGHRLRRHGGRQPRIRRRPRQLHPVPAGGRFPVSCPATST